MPPREWRHRIEDILEAIGRISAYTRGMSLDSFREDTRTLDAVVRNVIVIGEAAANTPSEVMAASPEIPWHLMKGMRNVVVHEYFGVDAGILWETAQRDLPALVAPLQALLRPKE